MTQIGRTHCIPAWADDELTHVTQIYFRLDEPEQRIVILKLYGMRYGTDLDYDIYVINNIVIVRMVFEHPLGDEWIIDTSIIEEPFEYRFLPEFGHMTIVKCIAVYYDNGEYNVQHEYVYTDFA